MKNMKKVNMQKKKEKEKEKTKNMRKHIAEKRAYDINPDLLDMRWSILKDRGVPQGWVRGSLS